MLKDKYMADVKATVEVKRFSAEELYKAFQLSFPIDERIIELTEELEYLKGQDDPDLLTIEAVVQDLKDEKAYSVIVKKLCCYFSNDPRFEVGDMKRKKGLMLQGGVGVGKSTLMKMFQRNQTFSYRTISCRDVESDFTIDGEDAIRLYSKNTEAAVNTNPFGHTEIGLCFDDLGTENAVTKHFGNAKNVMADILLNRYDKDVDPRATHITTNLSIEDIEKFYGTRVLDRIAENFNIITFDKEAKSRR